MMLEGAHCADCCSLGTCCIFRVQCHPIHISLSSSEDCDLALTYSSPMNGPLTMLMSEIIVGIYVIGMLSYVAKINSFACLHWSRRPFRQPCGIGCRLRNSLA